MDKENIDINNLPKIEKVGNGIFDLQQEPPEFATVAIEYPQFSVLNVVNITTESQNVLQELGNVVANKDSIILNPHEYFPSSSQDVLVSTNTQDLISNEVIDSDNYN